MPSIQQLILATIAAMATMAVAAPSGGGPIRDPPPFVGSWDDPQGLGIVARAPSATTAAAAAEATYTVGCGCWNICTLQKLANADLICPEVCGTFYLGHNLSLTSFTAWTNRNSPFSDPQFQCDIDPIAAKRDNLAAANAKRDVDALGKRQTTVTTTAGGGTVIILILPKQAA